MCSNPSSKRPRFQPPITKFFSSAGTVTEGRDSQDNGLSHDNYSSPTYSPTPCLPQKIQSSLLTVGMRIRKSVPEGYKTEPSKLTGYAIAQSVKYLENASRARPILYSRTATYRAELEPFCGIHKTGNLAVQTLPQPAENYHMDDDVPSLSAGADTSDNSGSSPAVSHVSPSLPVNPHKRAYDYDLDDLGDDKITSLTPIIEPSIKSSITGPQGTLRSLVTHGIWQDAVHSSAAAVESSLQSPITPISSHWTILFPKIEWRRQQLSPYQKAYKSPSGQENHDPSIDQGSMDIDDFEEAAFLQRREEVDSDCTASGTEVIMAD